MGLIQLASHMLEVSFAKAQVLVCSTCTHGVALQQIARPISYLAGQILRSCTDCEMLGGHVISTSAMIECETTMVRKPARRG